MRRQRTVEQDLASDLEVDGAVVLEVETSARSVQMEPVPVKSQTVGQKCWRSVREVDRAAVGVEELEGRREGPADPSQRQIGGTERAANCCPRTGQRYNYLTSFLAKPGQRPNLEKLPRRGCLPHYGGPDQYRSDSLPPQRVGQQAQAQVLVTSLTRAPA